MSKSGITGVMFGTLIEYYDYSLFGFSAAIIAANLLPQNAESLVTLSYAYAIYAVSYFSKPLGSLIFGIIGDRFGRRDALKITIIGISLPTAIIGMTPNYEDIGIYAVFILIFCRFLQGIFTAGEYDGAAIYIMEHMGKRWRATASSITRSMGVLGLLVGISVVNFFNSNIFPSWCWRIPFLLSLPFGIITLFYRKFLVETPEFFENKKSNASGLISVSSTKKLLKKHWKLMLLTVLMSGSFGITYQVAIIFMKQYLPIILPKSEMIVKSVSIIWVLAFGISMPISGLIADYLSPTVVTKYSCVMTIISGILFIIASNLESINLAIASCLSMAIFIAPFNCLAHSLMLSSFNVAYRYRAISIGHSTGSMLLSGTAQYLCLVVINNTGMIFFPIIYLMVFAVVAAIVAQKLYKRKIS